MVLLVGGLGIRVFWRRLRRRAETPELAPDPAAELRAKLAESKAPTESAPEAVQPVATTLDPSSRRRAIHDRARGAIDELR